MINSIQHFCREGVKNLEKVMVDYSADMTKIAELVQGVTREVTDLGLSMIAEEWEAYDELLRKRKDLRPGWHIVRRDENTLLTSLGSVTYRKTLFRNKHTGQHEYLLDRILGLGKHARLTEDAEAKILEEAVQTSYRRGGEHAARTEDVVSKEAVMNRIHELRFPKAEAPAEKKKVRYLYVDADEDHVALQYIDPKGDIRKPRENTVMPKLVYVYEGILRENKRNQLINPQYFGGVYDGAEGVEKLWGEVWDYIESSYDTEVLEKIYINGDGAAWIKTGQKLLDKAKFVLDRFHMHKYLIRATSHLQDSAGDARSELYGAIHSQRKKQAGEVFEKILSVTEGEGGRRRVEDAGKYILGNWAGIMQWVRDKNKDVQCSAEGHISHVYSDRMSSRPLGWSRRGADQMSRLRVYERNGGKMLELVRYQKRALPRAAGCEEVICSSSKMFLQERQNRKALGAMADLPVYSIPYPKIKKIAALKNHIWGL